MLYLLYGEDTYRSKKNLREITKKFLESGSANNLLRAAPEDFKVTEFAEVARSSALLGGKYLYVGEGLLADPASREGVMEELAAAGISENIIVFWEENIDEETLAALKREANKVTEFAKLSDTRLKNFILEEAAARGVKLSETQLTAIMEAHDGDLWGAMQDLEKLALGGAISFVPHAPEEGESMFDLLDAFAARECRRAVLFYEKYKSDGVPVEEIAWRLLWQLKVLSIVQLFPGYSPKEIRQETGLHEFVIKKNSAAAAHWRPYEAADGYAHLLHAMQSARIGETDLDNALVKILLNK